VLLPIHSFAVPPTRLNCLGPQSHTTKTSCLWFFSPCKGGVMLLAPFPTTRLPLFGRVPGNPPTKCSPTRPAFFPGCHYCALFVASPIYHLSPPSSLVYAPDLSIEALARLPFDYLPNCLFAYSTLNGVVYLTSPVRTPQDNRLSLVQKIF